MICRYETTVVARCPVDGSLDVYAATFEHDVMIEAEFILGYVRMLETKKDFQENITRWLAQVVGCKVTTVGLHSNVKTTVVAP